MKTAGLTIISLFILTLTVAADSSELPSAIQRGLSAFKTNGGRAAVENWTRGGPLEKTDAEKQAVTTIQKLEKLYGRFQDFSMIEEIKLSPASRLLYLEVQLTEGPVYFKFLVFAGQKGVEVVALELDPAPDKILPPHVLESKSIKPSAGR